ncbi:MAG: hypothetical protein IH921_05180 [Gemmatimonadetes bacterium]|nr:hypothetical protein [Gemmatimonadota bacterium]
MLRVALLVGSLVLLAACDEPTDLESASDRAVDVESAATEALEGVWTLVAREIRGGPNPRIEFGSQIQPSLLIYPEGYVMWAFVTGTEPRPVDATIGEAARQYISAGGTYELDGSTLRYNRIVSIGPGRMLPENQPYVRQLVTLTSNRLETATTNSAGVTTILKYARVE